ncbi:enoyl-CoA hydratase/isomerase family protein [Corynebacterium cystitidis]|uniref:Enoyl-CoA hydratase/carnithine racemase n=1 Tax=Corynebacterium cystitidis DSM 20524 TaxID=1121357 RepID=A0A1H9TPY6_9CORY|nr:enoyl-CoA hydratase-related protein [Corynebacterium cystitidis]WJY82001.1 putative enoyl-CoA hydratase echA8 [Corynebacterium cystitidis DSM 20524]SER99212.1 Enoyl-CoA hydratase/carnithine racemase [Corynebacterium cystitidis DSM 20524]SNV81011.1 enoyl-CoA hydratase [Corynebacterium cystitidis]
MIDLHFQKVAEGAKYAEVVLNDPATLNALAEPDLVEISQAYSEAEKAGVRALLLRGEGKGFCSGRNIKGLDPADDDATDYLANKVTPVLKQMSQFPAPTFAAVHGACLGVGLGLAIATDIVYVADRSKFGSPFANLGATLDSGGHALFVERLGAHRTMDLIVTGELISGPEAVKAGLFSRVLPADELLEFTREKVACVAQGATQAFLTSRSLVHDIRDNGTGLWASVEEENKEQGRLCSSADYAEGFAAFNEKRTPKFTGR